MMMAFIDTINDDAIPLRRFFPGLCAVCFLKPSENEKLKTCANCEMVEYCSKECQKMDWSVHKPLCRANAVVDGKNVFSEAFTRVRNQKDWDSLRTIQQNTTNFHIERVLKNFERDIIWFPKVCDVCKISDRSKLFPCPLCCTTFYCSEEHQNEDAETHALWCEDYQTCGIIARDLKDSDEKRMKYSTIVRSPYTALSGNMLEFIRSEFDAAVKQSVEINCGFTPLYRSIFSEKLTDPLTLLSTLQNYTVGKGNRKIFDVTALKVHIVGASLEKDLMSISSWEYLFHLLPQLKKLRVTFVGPDIKPKGGNVSNFCVHYDYNEYAKYLCDKCVDNKRKLSYDICDKMYHIFVEEEPLYCRPDVIIAYHCGFHMYDGLHYDTWPKSLSIMTRDESVPVIFTSFCKTEAIKDMQALEKLDGVKVTLPIQFNPFHCLRPVRDKHREDGCHMCYCNHYIGVINGTKIVEH